MPSKVIVEFLAPQRLITSEAELAILDRVSALQDVTPAPLGGIDLVLLDPQIVTLSGLTPDGYSLSNIPV